MFQLFWDIFKNAWQLYFANKRHNPKIPNLYYALKMPIDFLSGL